VGERQLARWAKAPSTPAEAERKGRRALKGGHLIDPLAVGVIVDLRCDVVFMFLSPYFISSCASFSPAKQVAFTKGACHQARSRLFFFAKLLESGIGAQRIPERIEPEKGRCNRWWAVN
jgi:hypothetical protein